MRFGTKMAKIGLFLPNWRGQKSKIHGSTFFGFFWFSMAQTLKNNLLDSRKCEIWPIVHSKRLKLGFQFWYFTAFLPISWVFSPFWLNILTGNGWIICVHNFLVQVEYPKPSYLPQQLFGTSQNSSKWPKNRPKSPKLTPRITT